MFGSLSNGLYRRLLTAQVVSLAGTGLATVALGLLAYDLAGEGAGLVLGTVFAIKMVAYVALAPVAAAVVHTWPRRTLLVVADLVRLVAVACLPFVTATWQVFALVFVLQAASAAHTPAYQATLPDVLPDEREYTEALSLSRLADDLEMLLSPVLAAVLLLVLPSSALFFGTAAGFAASAALVATSRLSRRRDGADDEGQPFVVRVRHGALVMIRTPGLRPVLALNVAVAAGGAFALVQYVVIARSWFGGGEATAALLMGALGVGSATVALLLPRVLAAMPARRVMLTGAGVVAISTALVPIALRLGPVGGLVATGAALAATGAGWSAAETPVGRLIRAHAAPADLPAVFAAQFSLSHAAWLVTYPLAGWLGGFSLDVGALLLAGLAAAATGLTAVLWPAPPAPRAGGAPGRVVTRRTPAG